MFYMRGFAGACVALSLCALFLAACARKPEHPEVPGQGDVVRIDVNDLREGDCRFFSYLHEGKRIDYMVLMVDGQVHSYFDACARCYPRKLGYKAAGGEVVCRACGETYALRALKKGAGSCYPIPLEGKLEGGSYLIRTDALAAGARYF